MRKRIFFGILYSIFVILFLFLNNIYGTTLFCAIISSMACSEILDVMRIKKLSAISIVTLLYAVFETILHCLTLEFPGTFEKSCQAIFFIYILSNFGLMFFDKNLKFKTVAKIAIVAVFVVFSLNFLIDLQNFSLSCNKNLGNFLILIALLMAWNTDIGAYFCGTFFGKNKLCEAISPKKTIEGFLGGTIFCVVSLIALVLAAEETVLKNLIKVDFLKFTLFCTVGSLISVFGDLCFSFIKRSCRVKDFGEIIPGHGGILDRFDSVIFVVPYFYFSLKFFGFFA